MKLSKLTQSRPTEAVLDFGDGDRVRVVYDRMVLTPAFSRQVRPVHEKLAACLISWDLEDDSGGVVAPAAEHPQGRASAWAELLETIPSDVIGAIYGGIWDDTWGGKVRGGGSPAI